MTFDFVLGWLTDTTFLKIPLASWLLSLLVVIASFFIMVLVLRFVLSRLRRITARETSTRFIASLIDVLSGTNRGLIALVALLIGIGMLDMPDRWQTRLSQLWFVALAIQIALWVTRLIELALHRYVEHHGGGPDGRLNTTGILLSWSLRTLLWAIVLLAVLSNIGVNITAFVASLGVGGIAVALAVQNILGDLFASLSIAVDKPFEIGDFIVVNGIAGSVEHVGLKTTRIRSLSGEQVVMSNTELLKQTINNYKRMETRRIVFKFGITYSSTPEQAEEVSRIVRSVIESDPKLKFDRAHLLAFGDSSLDYEVVYIVQDSSYNVYMDSQQAINVALMREFKRIGVDFAFPTRTVRVENLEPTAEVALATARSTEQH